MALEPAGNVSDIWLILCMAGTAVEVGGGSQSDCITFHFQYYTNIQQLETHRAVTCRYIHGNAYYMHI